MKKLFKKNQIIITALALMIAAAGYLSYTHTSIGDEGLAQTSAGLSEEDYDIVYDETLVDADIFAETEVDTKLDDTAAGDTGADETKTKKQQSGNTENQASDKKASDSETDSSKATDGKNADSKTTASANADTSNADAKTKGEQIENPGETVLTSTSVSNINFAVEAKLNREQVRSQNKEDLMEVINSTAISDKEKQDAVDKMVTLTDIAQRESDAEMLLEAKGFTDVVVSITEDAADVVLNMGDVTDAKRAQIEDIVKRKTKVSAENIVITPITTEKQE
ncbi:MAG: SpoIIIAH-like family protein [Eubacterium sp.]|nr:SpoIIIAH-like family protein [Eubacterium sp.]